MKLNFLIFILLILAPISILALISFPYDCLPEDREKDCQNEPNFEVCGWYNASSRCYDYPCAGHFPNACKACHNQWVYKVTAGICPRRGFA